MAKAKSCVPDMVAATKGILSEADATRLITEISRQAELRAKEKGIPVEDAVREVAEERQAKIELSKAFDKRAAALQAKALISAMRYTTTRADKGGKVNWVKNLKQFMENIFQDAQAQGNRLINSMFEAVGDKELLKKFRTNREFQMKVMEEEWNLSLEASGKKGSVTGDEGALIVAKAYHAANLIAVQMKNLYGADIRMAPGWGRPQTHDPMRLQEAGRDYQESLKAWKASLENKNIDWDRVLQGADKEEWLNGFHKNIYYAEHTTDADLEFNPYTKIGSLAKKASSERKLWFKDAASAEAYNAQWGRHDIFEGIQAHFIQAGRTIALLKSFGPAPEHNLGALQAKLVDLAKKREMDPGVVKEFQSEEFKQRLDFLSGKASSIKNATVAKYFEGIRNLTLLAKGANIVISTLGDRVFIATEAMARGVPRMQALGQAIFGRLSSAKDSKRIASELGQFMHANSGHVATRWMNETRVGGALSGGVHQLFSKTGLNWMTDIHQHNAGNIAATHLGQNSATKFDELPFDFRKELESFGIEQRDWDVMRAAAWAMEDGAKAITPDAVRDLPLERLNEELEARGLEPLSGNQKRLREDIAGKVGVYSYSFINRAVPAATLGQRTIMTLGASPKGTWSREVADMLLLFKGFPVAAAASITRNVAGEFSQGHYGTGILYLSSLLAQSVVAGYVILTIKDFLKGRTPRALWSDGEVNWANLTASAAQGGGLGIYGDFLFSEYDRRTRTPIQALAGPTIGTLADATMLINQGVRAAFGDEDVNAESLGYQGFRFAEQNTPFINAFYIKPILDYLIFWNIKEALSPGVFTRQVHSIEDKNHQEFFLEPIH